MPRKSAKSTGTSMAGARKARAGTPKQPTVAAQPASTNAEAKATTRGRTAAKSSVTKASTRSSAAAKAQPTAAAPVRAAGAAAKAATPTRASKAGAAQTGASKSGATRKNSARTPVAAATSAPATKVAAGKGTSTKGTSAKGTSAKGATPRATSARTAAKATSAKAPVNGATSAKAPAKRNSAKQAPATHAPAQAPAASRKAALPATRRQARAALPPVVPIRDKHSILGGAITVSPKGTEVLFMNASTRKSVTVSRNIASTVERAINILVPTEAGREAQTSAAITTGAKDLADGLMKTGVIEAENVTLTPRRANVDSKHPDQLVDEGKGLPIVVFDIRIKGEERVIGNLFALSPRKFTLVDVTGDLQSSKSNHLSVEQALIRIQVATGEFLSRRESLNQPSTAVA